MKIWRVSNRSEHLNEWFTQKIILLGLWMSQFPAKSLVSVETAVTIFDFVFHSITDHYCDLMNLNTPKHMKTKTVVVDRFLLRWALIPNTLQWYFNDQKSGYTMYYQIDSYKLFKESFTGTVNTLKHSFLRSGPL